MSEDAQRSIEHQRAVIAALRKENAALNAELEDEAQAAEMAPTRQQAEELAHLMDECDKYGRKIEVEHQNVEELTGLLGRVDDRASRVRRGMGGVGRVEEKTASLDAQVRTLENRVEKETVKFNQAMAENKRLRAEIDSLRKERLRFQGIYRKTERELERAREQTNQVLEATSAAREARDETNNMMSAMQAEQDRQAKAYDRAISHMQQIVEKDRGLMEIERQRQLAVADLAADTGREAPKREAWAGEDAATAEGKARRYADAIAAILSATNTDSVDAFAAEYQRVEEANFGAFNLQRGLDQEVGALEERLAAIRESKAKLAAEGLRNEEDRRTVVRQADGRVARAGEQVEAARRRLAASQEELGRVRATIGELASSVDALPRGHDAVAVTEGNVLSYVAAVEERASAIAAVYELVRDRDLRADSAEELLEQLQAAIEESDERGLVPSFSKRPQDQLGGPPAEVVPPTSQLSLVADVASLGGGGDPDEEAFDGPMLVDDLRTRLAGRAAAGGGGERRPEGPATPNAAAQGLVASMAFEFTGRQRGRPSAGGKGAPGGGRDPLRASGGTGSLRSQPAPREEPRLPRGSSGIRNL